MTDHLSDVLAETAAALGYCVGKLEGQTNSGSSVPTWVKNALSNATKPIAEADLRNRMEQQRRAEAALARMPRETA